MWCVSSYRDVPLEASCYRWQTCALLYQVSFSYLSQDILPHSRSGV